MDRDVKSRCRFRNRGGGIKFEVINNEVVMTFLGLEAEMLGAAAVRVHQC